jgi:hypothetical protein
MQLLEYHEDTRKERFLRVRLEALQPISVSAMIQCFEYMIYRCCGCGVGYVEANTLQGKSAVGCQMR